MYSSYFFMPLINFCIQLNSTQICVWLLSLFESRTSCNNLQYVRPASACTSATAATTTCGSKQQQLMLQAYSNRIDRCGWGYKLANQSLTGAINTCPMSHNNRYRQQQRATATPNSNKRALSTHNLILRYECRAGSITSL